MPRIFVSSTYLDLKDYRHYVSSTIRQMGHDDIAMEYFVAEDQRPLKKCLAALEQADLYVGIFAWRYGYIPMKGNRKQLSITELEYSEARQRKIPCLIFLLDESTAWVPDLIDDDRSHIRDLRRRLSEDHTVSYFRSPDDLARAVTQALHRCYEKDALEVLNVHDYLKALYIRFARLDLDVLTPPQKETYLQLQLQSIFVEQYVRPNHPPLELPKDLIQKLNRRQEIHSEDLPTGLTMDDVKRALAAYRDQPLYRVLDVLASDRHRKTVILGDPGAGKSTLARYLVLTSIRTPNDSRLKAFRGRVPFLVEIRNYMALRDVSKCRSFIEYLAYLGRSEFTGLSEAGVAKYLNQRRHTLVIFDGLDEIFAVPEREHVARQIVAFAEEFPTARVVVTSRVIGYRRKILTDANFSHFTLQDLDETQVAAFVNRWYSLSLFDQPKEARARQIRIMRSFRNSISIRQLAGNPMLLTIMVIIGKHQELPKERWKLYDHAARVLIELWDVNKHLKDKNIRRPTPKPMKRTIEAS